MKQIIVFGDIEMGAGNLTDDFIADTQLSRLISRFAVRKHSIDLILNGDTFDFLKCPGRLQPTIYPRHITKEISVAKLDLIYKAHTPVFQALKKFVSQKNKRLFFILGNHDHDLVYKEVRDEITRLLGNSSQIFFPGVRYQHNGVHVEHGHQYDFLFQINFEKLFLKHKGQSILNLPFVTFGLITAAMRLKEEHPFMERIFPRPALLTHHRVVARKLNRYTIGYFLKSLVFYPFRFYSDPTYSFPTNLLRELYKRIRTIHWDIDDITTIFKRQAQRSPYKIFVLGHIHEKRIAKGVNNVIIHPGSWRDEYEFNAKTRELVPRLKRYVEITIHNDQPSYELVDCYNKRSTFEFDAVLRDERAFLKRAAKEEGYPLNL